ncbi:MAG: DUF192 domain-containing protein [bacterium]
MAQASKKFVITLFVGLSAIIVLCYGPVIVFVNHLRPNKSSAAKNHSPKAAVGNSVIELEIADTVLKRAKGLSGRKQLAENTGLLFIFDDPGYPSFWMKDMHFDIDIIWLDENWQVVDITSNLSPKTFPHSFYPKAPTKYVIEIPAGEAGKRGIEIGSKLSINF